jgi:hypothetical protein
MFWDDIPEGELRGAVEAAERDEDGLAGQYELDGYRSQFQKYPLRIIPELREWVQVRGNWWLFNLVCTSIEPGHRLTSLPQSWEREWWESNPAVRKPAPRLLRDIFGPLPFRAVTVDPRWLTSTAVALARTIYEDRAFDRLPILADALEEAGCDNTDVLSHLRGDGPHVRGCWVLDLVLGKE